MNSKYNISWKVKNNITDENQVVEILPPGPGQKLYPSGQYIISPTIAAVAYNIRGFPLLESNCVLIKINSKCFGGIRYFTYESFKVLRSDLNIEDLTLLERLQGLDAVMWIKFEDLEKLEI